MRTLFGRRFSAGARSSDDDEQTLWATFKNEGSDDARRELFSRYWPLARRIAARFHRPGSAIHPDFQELCQLASAGLLEAIDRFRPEREVPFRYYCNRRISGSILDGMAIATEVSQQISFRRKRLVERLASLRSEAVADGSVDVALDVLGDIAAGLALGLMLEGTGMYADDERDGSRDAYETLEWKQALERVTEEVSRLPERDRDIIRYHYVEGLRFDQIGQVLGVSKGRVSQLHKSAMILLRRRLLNTGHFQFKV